MTPRERFICAIGNRVPDRIPFVVWDNKLPDASSPRRVLLDRLFELQTCVTVKASVYCTELEGVECERDNSVGPDGEPRSRSTYHTSKGDLVEVVHPRGDTSWTERRLFSGPNDYEALEELIRAHTYVPRFEEFERAERRYGDHSVARPATIKGPMQELMYTYMGVETFCMEWMDNRRCVMRLVEALREDRSKKLRIVAASNAAFAIVEANIAPEIVGYDRFRDIYVPEIEDACALLHGAGKLAGAHLDSNNRLLAPLVAGTSLDFIESFTPPPECDLSISEARGLWQDKAIVVNFPSSVHLKGHEAVRSAAAGYLKEFGAGRGAALGVLENLPGPATETMTALAETVFSLGSTG